MVRDTGIRAGYSVAHGHSARRRAPLPSVAAARSYDKKARTYGPSVCALLLLLGAAFNLALAQEKATLSIGTGFPSGVYYPMGKGIAGVISKYLPGNLAKVEATGGSVDNLKLLATHHLDVGFSMADVTWDAYNGLDKFKSGKLNVRALLVLYANSLHVVVLDRPDINKISDLKGKRLATGAPGSATEVMALRVLEAHGMDKDRDIVRHRLALEESVNALKENKVDALFWCGGVPTNAIVKLASTPESKIKFLDHDDAVEAMVKKYGPLYSKHQIPAATYPGLGRNVRVAGVWNILVASEDMDAGKPYAIVKTIFERKAEIAAAHKEAANISLEYQTNDRSPIPYHPGAIRYFAEQGIKLR